MRAISVEPRASADQLLPLCVDLDGTLVCTDTLVEQLFALVRKKPKALFVVLLSLFHGIAVFKRRLANEIECRADLLPYNEQLLNHLKRQLSLGRRILLVTAADQDTADRVAEHLGIFETAIGSDGVTNLKAAAKVEAIRQYLGPTPFEYAGNSRADIPVWEHSDAAILIDCPRGCRSRVERSGTRVTAEYNRRAATVWTVARAMRVYQWAKNFLVFVPLFLSHTFFQASKLVPGVASFLALSFAASSVYIVNDLLDLESDRRHPRKRKRPFAAGALQIRDGICLAMMLIALAALASCILPFRAQLLLAAYLVMSSLYSTILKQKLFMDVMVLAGLYTLRILYGGAATHTKISPATLAFSIFLFISLAICKRLTELRRLGATTAAALPGRAYSQQDLTAMSSLGSASGYAAILVLALYISSPDVMRMYTRPNVLWVLCPLLAYWISRMLIIANRGEMDDDPILFSARDRSCYAVAAAALIAVVLAIG